MLIARLLGWIKGRSTLHIFLLEILAVFIGITASLFIDDWRQRQNDFETLDHLLQETHYNSMQVAARVRSDTLMNHLGLESAMALRYGDLSSISDAALIQHLIRLVTEMPQYEPQAGYRRLSNTSLSIPFDKTMAELDSQFGEVAILIRDVNALKRSLLELAGTLRRSTATPLNIAAFAADPYEGGAARYISLLNSLFSGNADYVEAVNDTGRIRAALQTADGLQLMDDVIAARYSLARKLVDLEISHLESVRTIRDYEPDITLPIGHIGIDGAATGRGWNNSVTMRQDRRDPNTWRLRITLDDGPVKFRADDDWATNWGVRPNRDNVSDVDSFTFAGADDTAFPHGTGELNGLNIPVKAGTYDVTFNTQTFEYSFELVED